MGIAVAGIGNTGDAGGTERAIDPRQDRKVQTTALWERCGAGGWGRELTRWGATNANIFLKVTTGKKIQNLLEVNWLIFTKSSRTTS